MEVPIVKIGNSRGLRLSKMILEKYHIKDKVELIFKKSNHIQACGRATKGMGFEV